MRSSTTGGRSSLTGGRSRKTRSRRGSDTRSGHGTVTPLSSKPRDSTTCRGSMREARLIPRRSEPLSGCAASTSVTWRSRSPSTTRRRSPGRGRRQCSSTCSPTRSCSSTTATTRSGWASRALRHERRLEDSAPRSVRQLRVERAPCVPVHIGPDERTGRDHAQAVALRGLDRPLRQRIGHASASERRWHVRLNQHDRVWMAFVPQCRKLSGHLRLEAAVFRIVADDELSGGPDANAGHNGIGWRIARRKCFFDGVVQFVYALHTSTSRPWGWLSSTSEQHLRQSFLRLYMAKSHSASGRPCKKSQIEFADSPRQPQSSASV